MLPLGRGLSGGGRQIEPLEELRIAALDDDDDPDDEWLVVMT